MKIGDVIYFNRTRLGLSQGELAKRAQTSDTYINVLEAGIHSNPTLKMILRLSAALDIPPHLLLGDDVEAYGKTVSLAEAIQTIIEHDAQIPAIRALTESLAATVALCKVKERRRETGEIR